MSGLKIKKSRRQKAVRKIYWPKCSVCQYMKKNKEFRERVMGSTYFLPEAQESLAEVNRAFNSPFTLSNLYGHMQRHQHMDLVKAQKKFEITDKGMDVIEGKVVSGADHEMGLDEFILEGRAKLASGDMKVNATSYLQAIKIKADIEKSTKDRRLDAIKAFFGGSDRLPKDSEGTSQN